MKKIRCAIIMIFLLVATFSAVAQPANFNQHLSAYREYIQSLWHLSEKAEKATDQQSQEYLEMYSQGHFFKDRLTDLTRVIKKQIKADPEATLKQIKAWLVRDSSGREYATFRKLLGYNVRVLKAKNPRLNVMEILPPRPGTAPAAASSAELFLSIDEKAMQHVPAPAGVSKWAKEDYERVVAPAPQTVKTGFEAYLQPEAARQEADQLKTGWVSSQYAVRQGTDVVIKASEMNVRAGASTDYPAIGKVRGGQHLPFLAESNGWFQVSLPTGPQTAAAYRKITMVKGVTPFLVQMDSFLNSKEVVLTFDDGPTTREDRTSAITKALNDAAMPAIFFMLGSTIQQSPLQPLVKMISQSGGYAAVHGFYHATSAGKPFTAIPWETVRKHLVDTKNLIKSITGNEAVFFRPPYGIIRAEDLRHIEGELNLIPVGWTIDSLDWSIKSADELFIKITGLIKQRGKGILLMHDIHPQSRAVVPRLLAWLQENGYRVVGPERLIDGFRAAQQVTSRKIQKPFESSGG